MVRWLGGGWGGGFWEGGPPSKQGLEPGLSPVFAEFLSHSFSVPELRFLFLNVLPDLTDRVLVDVGSRLGAVLFGGHVFSSASGLVGVELNQDFVTVQNQVIQKYGFEDRVQVVHSDICSQDSLVQNADVLVMNNVFEFFLEPPEQIRCWRFLVQNFRRKGSLLVTVPGLDESFRQIQEALPSDWLEELPVNYDLYLTSDSDQNDCFRQIHLYRVM
uniref:Methyltransferase type 11 domain-containing protein n=1 Tax=Knipowitschia caucasica TaxID=637954 RepID=A0AAV2JFR0_KNICA